MSILGTPLVAAVVARAMQALIAVTAGPVSRRRRMIFPEFRPSTRDVTIPTSIAPAPAVVYQPSSQDSPAPVHVNFHGGGYVMPGLHLDDPLCRYLAAEAGVVVVNIEYVVAPRYPFPAPPHQAFQVIQWIAEHGEVYGWDGGRLTIGGQSAGGGLAAAAARQALEQGGQPIALQVLHYAPLDLTIPGKDKRSVIAKPVLRPWMGEVFDSAYVPDPAVRADPLVSPANPADIADLTGIAPALVITAELDRLRAEGQRYAQRLQKIGALVEHHDVPLADHGYDMNDLEKARETYALIARQIRRATQLPC